MSLASIIIPHFNLKKKKNPVNFRKEVIRFNTPYQYFSQDIRTFSSTQRNINARKLIKLTSQNILFLKSIGLQPKQEK
jgi:hypothetical protein